MAAGAIFDVDGTLVDSVDLHAHAWQDAFAHFGKQVPFADVRSQIGKGGDQLIPFFLTEKELAKIGQEALEQYRGQLFKREYMHRVRAFPRVRELIATLKERGTPVALASSAKSEELAFYKEVAGIDDLIEAETSADDATRTKPEPDIFQAALVKLHMPKARGVVVIGDSPFDALAARKLSLPTLGMLCGGFDKSDLEKAGCTQFFRDPADLLERLAESPLG